MSWNNDRIKRYMEIGMAVLLVLTLGLAGAAGLLSARAETAGKEAAAEADSGVDSGKRMCRV